MKGQPGVGEVAGLADVLNVLENAEDSPAAAVDLGLTGFLGAVLLVLAAIQSFRYEVPIPDARTGAGDCAAGRPPC